MTGRVERGRRAVTPTTLGAWLIKGSGAAFAPGDLDDARIRAIRTWCLRPTYRADLVEAGQPVLLWVSGNVRTHPAGIYAEGATTGRAVIDSTGGSATRLMPVALRPLAAPVLRTDLLAHPELSRIEVLTMPAGSNPSFLTRSDLVALRSDWPQVTTGS